MGITHSEVEAILAVKVRTACFFPDVCGWWHWISDPLPPSDHLAQGWLMCTRHFLLRPEKAQISLLPAFSAWKDAALKPTSSSAMQIDCRLWPSNEAERNGSEKTVSFGSMIYFRLAAQTDTLLFSNLLAWWMVPQQMWTEKLQRWWQPALNSCLVNEPQKDLYSLQAQREEDCRKERNLRKISF